MPVITGVEKPRRPSGAVVVQVDGAPFCVAPEDVARRHRVAVGRSLTDQALAELAADCARAAALEDALRYLSYRPRSRRELDRYLRRRGHEDLPADVAIRRCQALGYVDDREFAVAFARERIRLRPRGKRVILKELGRLGVERSTAEDAVAEAFTREEVSEGDLLKRLAAKRARQLAGDDPVRERRLLVGYLVRRGFRHSDVQRVLEDLSGS